MVNVAQFGRAPGCDPGGHGFETHRSPQLSRLI